MLSLYAAFNANKGEIVFKAADRHTSAEFVAILTDIVVNQPCGEEIHVIADDLSDHNSQPVKDLLEAHPQVQLHFIPTYSSGFDTVELSLDKTERETIGRGETTTHRPGP
jgi:transposase